MIEAELKVEAEEIAAVIATLKAAGFYVNARGMTNTKGAAHLLCLSISRLGNLQTQDKGQCVLVPPSFRPGGARGPRYYLVRDILEFIEKRSAPKNIFSHERPSTPASAHERPRMGVRMENAGARLRHE